MDSGRSTTDTGRDRGSETPDRGREAALLDIIEGLRDDLHRRVLARHYWDRQGDEAIARNLDITTEAARKVGARALLAPRTDIGPDDAPF